MNDIFDTLIDTYEKACNRLKNVRMLKHQMSRKVLINICLSIIRPVLEYTDIV